MTEQDKMQSLYMIMGMERVKKYQRMRLVYLNYLKISIKIGHKEKIIILKWIAPEGMGLHAS